MIKNFIVLLAACVVSTCALAQVTVTQPWVRATVPAQKAAGAFMQVQSAQAARLVGVSTPVAGRAELHTMEMQGQVMKMHQVDGIDLPAGQPVNLASGGYHIMFFDLKRQLKEGETVPLTLVVQGADRKRERVNVSVSVPVRPIGFSAPSVPAAH
jgi:copper(I)-binding protein